MKYGYARVSSYKQLKEGNSLEDQVEQLRSRGCEEIVQEQYTATTTDRPKFNELISKMEVNDTLMCTTLDRFCRSTEEGIILINKMLKEGKFIHIIDLGFIEEGSLTHKVLVPLLLSVGEMEREKIILRCKSGKVIARSKPGFREGRPTKFTETQINYALTLLKEHSYSEVEKMTLISKSTLVREVRKRKEITIMDNVKNIGEKIKEEKRINIEVEK